MKTSYLKLQVGLDYFGILDPLMPAISYNWFDNDSIEVIEQLMSWCRAETINYLNMNSKLFTEISYLLKAR